MDNFIKIIDSKMNIYNNVMELFDFFYNYNLIDWQNYRSNFFKSNDKCYQKYILNKTDRYELILIKWDKGAETEIHSHPENGCLLKVLEGELKEEKYLNESKYKESNIKKNLTSYMHDNLGKHKITALEDSYSIHLYSPSGYYK